MDSNDYIRGSYALAAKEVSEFDSLRLSRPMLVETGHRVIAEALEMTNNESIMKQLLNIDMSLNEFGELFLPDSAADILSDLAESAAEEPGDTAVERTTARESAQASWAPPTVPGDIIGADAFDVLGMIDIGSAQLKMNGLKPVTVRIAQLLLKGGQDAINGAIAGARQPWYKKNLPGETARQEVFWKLDWHKNAIAQASGGSPNAIYQPGDDLKKWAMQAFIEANAVEEGAAYLDAVWVQMWKDIGQALAELPAEIRKAVFSGTNWAVQSVTGLPIWAWGLIGVGAVAGLIALTLKLANSRAGGAIGGHLARKYL